MGWTGRKVAGSIADLVRREMTDGERCKVIDLEAKGHVYYLAWQKQPKDGGTPLVLGVVVLTERRGDWIYTKEMTECELPYYYDCPVRILNQLSHVDRLGSEQSRENALTWRERCRDRARGLVVA